MDDSDLVCRRVLPTGKDLGELFGRFLPDHSPGRTYEVHCIDNKDRAIYKFAPGETVQYEGSEMIIEETQ